MRSAALAAFVTLVAVAGLAALAAGCARPRVPPPITRNRLLESLEQAVHWPAPTTAVIMTLANEYLTTHREREGFAYFDERSRSSGGGAPDGSASGAGVLPRGIDERSKSSAGGIDERSKSSGGGAPDGSASGAGGLPRGIDERSKSSGRPTFLALSGLFQARLAPEVPLLERAAWVEAAAAKLDRAAADGGGLERFLRGVVFCELPERFGRARQGALDLEWVLASAQAFPPGFRRGAWRGLAAAYATLGRTVDAARARKLAGPDATPFLTNSSVNAADGFRFVPRELRELPGGVFLATGYDFADLAFVVVDQGIVAIDAGTTEATAAEALAALRTKTAAPIRAVIMTHAHWDHIGGLGALVGPDTEVIAQSRFPEELRIVNAVPPPFQFFFGNKVESRFAVAPGRLISQAETLAIGGRRFGLYPAHGGETEDALLVHVPDAGVLFVGDAFMPYLGAPFVAEGSTDGLLDTIAQILAIAPTRLIHGHEPLTANFTVEAMAPLGAALAVVRDHAAAGAHAGRPLADILGENLLPDTLAGHPAAVLPFLLLRDNLTKRLYQQQSGYWKADGEGMEVFTRAEWGRAIDLLAGGDDGRFVAAARTLEQRGDFAMALRIAELGLAAHADSATLAGARRRALEGLRLKYQYDPFKLIIYSEMLGAPVGPVPAAR